MHGAEHKEADYEENGDVWIIGDRVQYDEMQNVAISINRRNKTMKYSLKKHLQHNTGAFSSFFCSIAGIIFAVFFWIIFSPTLINSETGLIVLFLPTICLLAFPVLLLIIIHKEKDFLNNCQEIDAKIVKNETVSTTQHMLFESRFDKKGMIVTFAYAVNGKESIANYYIPNNKHTKNYFDIYTKTGSTVTILVSRKNHGVIKIKEEYK